MLTTGDIRKLIDSFSVIFATKDELQKLEERVNQKFSDVMTKLDAVFKEVKDMRQEQTVHSQQHEDIRDELNSIKKHIGMPL